MNPKRWLDWYFDEAYEVMETWGNSRFFDAVLGWIFGAIFVITAFPFVVIRQFCKLYCRLKPKKEPA